MSTNARDLPPDPGIFQRLLEMLGIREPAPLPTPGRLSVGQNLIPRGEGNEQLAAPSPEFLTLVDSLVNAPFARDTLFPLIGGPPTLSAGGLTHSVLNQMNLFEDFGIPAEELFIATGILGETLPEKDLAQVNEITTFGKKPEDVLTHESGHIFDFRNPRVPVGINPIIDVFIANLIPGGVTGDQTRFTHLRNRLREDLKKFRDSGSEVYAATNPREHFAVSFLNAINLLRNPETTRQDISAADAELPGVKNVADFLLEHTEIFKGHPLNKKKKKKGEKDA